MKFTPHQPPRKFRVGQNGSIELSDCGRIHLAADEQVTFESPAGGELDVAAKSWGFYATPSVNGRLVDQGFRTALVRSSIGRVYVMVVDRQRLDDFADYCRGERQEVLEWLDER